MEGRRGSTQEARKARILQTIERLDRPIWLGDLDPKVSEHGALRAALRELQEAGLIVARREGPGRRVYYSLKPD